MSIFIPKTEISFIKNAFLKKKKRELQCSLLNYYKIVSQKNIIKKQVELYITIINRREIIN